MYNVFNSQNEAETAQFLDFTSWKETRPQQPEVYWEITTAWDSVKQRFDGKWVYKTCPEGSQLHTQEQYQPNWFDG